MCFIPPLPDWGMGGTDTTSRTTHPELQRLTSMRPSYLIIIIVLRYEIQVRRHEATLNPPFWWRFFVLEDALVLVLGPVCLQCFALVTTMSRFQKVCMNRPPAEHRRCFLLSTRASLPAGPQNHFWEVQGEWVGLVALDCLPAN